MVWQSFERAIQHSEEEEFKPDVLAMALNNAASINLRTARSSRSQKERDRALAAAFGYLVRSLAIDDSRYAFFVRYAQF